uniref:RING-type E3 ubiquitin transferase n=1 Tax=Setaria viridis TaxID=4556 RepID=A0A4U6UYH4_SETVI|nr:hypothetical protein SEVIR_4G141100v2 [Setaria viridis]
MSIPFPWVPTPGIIFPPPPPHPPPPPWSPPPSPTPKSAGGAIAGQRQSGADAVADAATESAALGSRLRTAAPDQPRGAALPDGEPRRAGPAADLPSFTYNRSVKHNVTGSGDEAATCSVCLAAFRVGETVRLLPVCLHLYHVECIDPWLDAHSSCPICRTGTDLAMDGGLLPPV